MDKNTGDIVEFLKNKRKGIVVKTFNWWSPLRSRIWVLVGALKGYFSFSEFCQLLLPMSFGNKAKLMDRFDTFLCEELARECPGYPDNYVNLFGHKFGGIKYSGIIELLNEVIISDQYCASQFLKKDSIIIDAGAHIGTFSILAAQLSPGGRVYSFEPVASNFKLLKNNTKYYPQIICENFGLGDGDQMHRKNIFVPALGSSGSVFEDSPYYGKFDERGAGKMEVADIFSIDNFVAENNIAHVDFIKIDTEGYEAKILKGAQNVIKKWKPVIAMSAYHNPKDKEDLPRIVKEICPNYICECYKEAEEDFICQVKNSGELIDHY